MKVRSLFPIALLLLSVTPSRTQIPEQNEQLLYLSKAVASDSRGEIVYTHDKEDSQTGIPVSGIYSPPKPLKTPKPKYPASLRKVKKELDVLVIGVIAPAGDIIDAKVDGNVDSDVQESALLAVSRFKIQPAKLDGKPIAIRVRIAVEFRL